MPTHRHAAISLLASFLAGGANCGPVLASDISLYDDLETVEVTAERDYQEQNRGTVTSVNARQFNALVPVTFADVLILAPSINVRTNSRGETLASIRGSGERQLALFWNNIPINVPWDNRFDLSLLPAAGIAGYEVLAGVTPNTYGSNVAGGIVNISMPSRLPNSVSGFIGDGDLSALDGAVSFSRENYEQSFAFSHFDRDGIVSAIGGDEFSREQDGLITNTDRKSTSIATKATMTLNKVELGASLLFIDAEFGVAPEQGARIDIDNSRFWRFPDSRHFLAAVDATITLSRANKVSAVFWMQDFDQEIQSFDGIDFLQPTARQLDENLTVGTKVAFEHERRDSQTSLVLTGLWSRHNEQQQPVGEPLQPDERFSQRQVSVGFDHSRKLSNAVTVAIGGGYDLLDPGATAERPPVGQFDGFNGSFNLTALGPNGWSYRLGAARKIRLPTMRELFGEALGRFLVNPDLKPETNWIFEASANYVWSMGQISFTPFWTETSDTLDQALISVDGNLLRQRINLRGSRSYGVETRAEISPTPALTLDGYATWNRNRVKAESVANSTRRRYLSDRPNWLARIGALYQLGTRTTFGLSVVHRGAAKSEAADGEFLDLAPATIFNMSARHRLLNKQSGSNVEIFAQLDNLTDAFVEPQLGLPDAGRTFKVGLRALF